MLLCRILMSSFLKSACRRTCLPKLTTMSTTKPTGMLHMGNIFFGSLASQRWEQKNYLKLCDMANILIHLKLLGYNGRLG